MPAALCAKAFDRFWALSPGLTLAALRPLRPPGPFDHGESFYFVPAAQLPEHVLTRGQPQRLCILGADGSRRLALGNEGLYRELHVMSDMGTVGLVASLWYGTDAGMVATFCSDVVAHDAHNAVKAACVQSGLWVVVLEVALCSNFLTGPFGSDGNFQDFKDCAKDLWAYINNPTIDPFPAFLKKPSDWTCSSGPQRTLAQFSPHAYTARPQRPTASRRLARR